MSDSSFSLATAEIHQNSLVEEIDRLRQLTASLDGALSIAVFRLAQAGLPHNDLQGSLKKSHVELQRVDDPSSCARTINESGPYVFGTLLELEDFRSPLRFVFDSSCDRIEMLQFGREGAWVSAEPVDIERFGVWLLEDNEDMIDHPENWQLEKSDSLPAWFG